MIDLEQYAGETKFPVADEAEYELVIANAEKKTTRDGSKEFINVDFLIRDDVEQKFQKTHVFHKIWKDKDNPEWFDLKQIGRLLKTQKNKEGYRTKFEDTDEFIQYMNGFVLRAKVQKTYDDAIQGDVNSINIFSYEETRLGAYVKPEAKAEPKAEEKKEEEKVTLNIPDSALPF